MKFSFIWLELSTPVPHFSVSQYVGVSELLSALGCFILNIMNQEGIIKELFIFLGRLKRFWLSDCY